MPKRKDIGSGEISGDALQPQKRTSIPAQVPVDGPRSVLHDFNSLDKLVETLQKCKRIVVVTGAGISVSCGIPDFRSENGVYNIASRLDLGLSCPEDLFDLEFFTDDPAPFFKFARALYPGNYVPSLTHRFLKALEDRGKLLRNFTQNIDGLEAQVGLTKYIACHGSFLTATCLSCKAKRKAEDIRAEVMRQEVPYCSSCGNGVMKPDITFFGEKLPTAVKRAVEVDRKKADLLLVLGTSLQVAPVSRILQFIPGHVPQVSVNREAVHPPKVISEGFDLHLLGNCDDVIRYLCSRLEWELPSVAAHPGVPIDTSVIDTVSNGQKADGSDIMNGGVSSAGKNTEHPRASPVFVEPNIYTFACGDRIAEGGLNANGSSAGLGSCEDNASDAAEFEEVVTCDGCSKVIHGEIYACRQCFDFDLCETCYAGGSHPHARQPGHSFRASTSKPSSANCVADGCADSASGIAMAGGC